MAAMRRRKLLIGHPLIRLFDFADERNGLVRQGLSQLAFIEQFESVPELAAEQRNTNLR